MTNHQAATAFIAIELDSEGVAKRLAMAFKKKTLLVFASKGSPLEIPQSWRQDLSAWDDGLQIASPYPADSAEDVAIRRLAKARDISMSRVLTIDDIAPDAQTKEVILGLLKAAPDQLEEIAQRYQEAVASTPF
ncbi:hypothetical protein F3I62_19150 [Pseudomonas sp. R-28-1W-6]|uniref:hypothetical protein n=1 Tax=Pseudomonas sp. R-28-1W-6 TaxID=2650101 RepID=UPI001365FB82|nr:hypothetical protein [Pseudomonas sp. R-28-1W-6]MWV14224.1 hypothetical protein [Pseudomonas sp. R-28-1W-6]